MTPVGNTFTRVEIYFLAVLERMFDNAVTLVDISFVFPKFCIREDHKVIHHKPYVNVSANMNFSHVLEIFSFLKTTFVPTSY